MNKRQKKKQIWKQWLDGDYKAYKTLQKQRHEQTIVFKRKGRAGHLTEEDIKNFWMEGLEIEPDFVEQICSQKRAPRGSKTAFKKASKAVAYCTFEFKKELKKLTKIYYK